MTLIPTLTAINTAMRLDMVQSRLTLPEVKVQRRGTRERKAKSSSAKYEAMSFVGRS